MIKLPTLQGDPVVGLLDLGVVYRDGVVVAGGVAGEVEHAPAAGVAVVVLLKLCVDEEGRRDDAEQQGDATQNCAHDLEDNFECRILLLMTLQRISDIMTIGL